MASVKLNSVSFSYKNNDINNSSIKKIIISGFFKKNSNKSKKIEVIKNLDLDLRNGDILGIAGPNGSGKTSLLKLLSGIYTPTQGKISIIGKITTMLDLLLGLDLDATGREYIKLRCLYNGLNLKQIASIEDEIIEFSELRSSIDRPIRTYSSGMNMRLGFSISTAINSEILIMDEWLSVGDSDFIIKAEKRLKENLKKASIVIIASHSEKLLDDICTKKIILNSRKL